MAENPKEVIDMIETLRSKSKPVAEKEVADMRVILSGNS